jgi:hypothetical protein
MLSLSKSLKGLFSFLKAKYSLKNAFNTSLLWFIQTHSSFCSIVTIVIRLQVQDAGSQCWFPTRRICYLHVAVQCYNLQTFIVLVTTYDVVTGSWLLCRITENYKPHRTMGLVFIQPLTFKNRASYI